MKMDVKTKAVQMAFHARKVPWMRMAKWSAIASGAGAFVGYTNAQAGLRSKGARDGMLIGLVGGAAAAHPMGALRLMAKPVKMLGSRPARIARYNMKKTFRVIKGKIRPIW